MAGFDGEEFGRQIVEAVNASIERSIAPLMARLDRLEAIDIKGIVSEEVKDIRGAIESVVMPEMQEALAVMVREAVPTVPEPVDLSPIQEQVRTLIAAVEAIPAPPVVPDVEAMIKSAIDALPAPVNLDPVHDQINELRKDLEALPPPPVVPDVEAMIKSAIDALPAPAEPVNLDPVHEQIDELRKAVEAIPAPPVVPDVEAMIKSAIDALPAPAEPVDLSPIQEQVRTLIQAVEALPPPPVIPDVETMIKTAIDALPAPVNLDSVHEQINELRKDLEALPPLPEPPVIPELPDIAGMIKAAIDALPAPVIPELPDIPALVKEAVDAIEITVTEPELPDFDVLVRSTVDARLTKGLEEYRAAIEALPVPQDGKSVTVDDVRPLIDDAVSKAVAQIPVPKNGRDGVDAMDSIIDQKGHLIITFSDGRTKDVGQVVGDDGVDCDIDGVWKILNQKLEALPKPKDGLGFDDMRFEYDGERTFKLIFERGDQRKEFPFIMPVILDRGVYSEGKTYQRGDCVTWGGSRWIAQKDGVSVKPDEHKGEWLLSVKRGQPGKNGELLQPRPNVPVKLGRN